MAKIYLDTNALVSFFTSRNSIQSKKVKKTLKLAESSNNLNLILTHEIILETIYVLKSNYSVTAVFAHELITNFIKESFVKIENKGLVLQSLKVSADLNINFIDCLLFLKSKEDKAQILTFDTDFKKLENWFSTSL